MAKNIYDSASALRKLLNGVDKVADTVKQTLGPNGRNIILQKKYGSPISCSDGVTIARDIMLHDRLENAGAQFLIEASKTTNDQAGDGTTTVCVLAQSLIHEGFKALQTGKTTSVKLVNDLNKCTKNVVKYLKEVAKPIETNEELVNVATISCGGDAKLGKLVADAVEEVGQYGVCSAEPGPGVGIKVTHVDGMAFDRGYINPLFMTDTIKQVADYSEALVCVTMKTLSRQEDVLPLLNVAAQAQKPLLLICENLTEQALLVTLANIDRGSVKVVATRLPGFSTFIEPMTKDICAITGAKLFDQNSNIQLVKEEDLGSCTRLQVSSSTCKFAGPEEPTGLIQERLEQAKLDLEKYKTNNDDWAVERTQERIARLGKGATLIQVGARTELEQKELLYRVEDAVQACKAALEEGIVPGAGNIQLKLACYENNLEPAKDESENIGRQVFREALCSLFKQLEYNSDIISSENTLKKGIVKGFKNGYNPLTGELVDLFKAGIIDPAKVTRCSLENAISVATTLLRTAGAVVEENEIDNKSLMEKVQEEHSFETETML